MNYEFGSIWRKWDLHFHTPSSFDYHNMSVTNQEIIDELSNNNIALVAITDHHTIDITRIKELQQLGEKKNITVLPGIEFRSELGGSDSIHFIGIFPEDCNLEEVWMELQTKCKIKPSDITEKGNDNIYADLKDTSNLIKALGGLVSVHAGSKTNTIENITNTLSYKMAQKIELVESIDIYELGKVEDQSGYKEIVFPAINKVIPMILCSDNHNIKEYILKENLWIKADPTFEGLKQLTYEPTERVKIQSNDPFCDFTKPFFNKIVVTEQTDIFIDQSVKFDTNEIILNQNLVSIIGGRGEGKSILIDYFARGFGYSKKEYNLSHNFLVQYSKSNCSDDFVDFGFDTSNNLEFLYIPQTMVRDIALQTKELGQEIRKMLNLTTIGFSKETQNKISTTLDEYNELEDWFNQVDNDGKKINNKDNLLQESKRFEELLNSITNKDNKEKLEKYTENIKIIRNAELKFQQLDKLSNRLNLFESDINKSIIELDKTISLIEFKKQYDDINKLKEISAKEIGDVNAENEDIKSDFSGIYKGDLSSLLDRADEYKSNIEDIRNSLAILSKKEFQRKEKKEEKDKIADNILDELKNQENIINNAWQNLLSKNTGWTEEQRNLMQNILSDREIEIKGKIFFDEKSFYIGLKDHINGTHWRNKNKSGELEKYFKINGFESLCDFIKNKLEQELKANPELFYINTFEKYFYELSERNKYLFVQPEITYKGKTLEKISIGQRGTVYLCLKLATNPFSTPIIYDQPEDDLDNQFIINELVSIFKAIKIYRQVIIVTHNANLVVNSDSEQVIVAHNDNEVLTYTGGALENPTIIDSVCKILEGGRIAFEQRKNKYKI
ncbi:MAG: hypothetical protein Q8N83_03640 [Ignavibacteria bacterium]|nr:hypothetical protein [Ignavibacteria bacterium]